MTNSESTPAANGWTLQEAEAMDTHISGKVAREASRTEPSNAEYRKAERAADPTDRLHDDAREHAANTHARRAEAAQAPEAAYWAGVAAGAKPESAIAETEQVRQWRAVRV